MDVPEETVETIRAFNRFYTARLGVVDELMVAVADPDGVVWETFLTNGDATIYGDSPTLNAASLNASNDSCCAPALRSPEAEARTSCG